MDFPTAEWIEPPDGIIGADAHCAHNLVHDDRLCLRLDRVLVYPNGLTLDLELWVAVPPLSEGKDVSIRFPWALVDASGPHDRTPLRSPSRADDQLFFGVSYPDGRRFATEGFLKDQNRDLRVTGRPPEDLVVRDWGGSGSPRHHVTRLWLWPRPPPGPVTIFVKWPSLGIPETSFEIPAAALENAAPRIMELWPD